jgi:hypothetical protein
MNEYFETRLGAHRYEASALELDELKRRAISQASRNSKPQGARSRLVTSFLAVALTLSGGSAVIASSSGTSSGGQPSASVSQYEQLVLGERIIPGSARLVSPTGCVARVFHARVRGINAAKVVFKLDGKTIATMTKPTRLTDRYSVRIDPSRLQVGVHRITVTVTFKASTQKKARTFRISFQRCPQRLSAPRFTG